MGNHQMNKYKTLLITVCIGLNIVALLMLALSVLALHDILIGTEPDLTSEWTAVKASIVFIFIALTFSVITLAKYK